MKDNNSVTMKFDRAELKSRQEVQEHSYKGRFTGNDSFEGRYCNGGLEEFTEIDIQFALTRYAGLIAQGYTPCGVDARQFGTKVVFYLAKPANVQEIELKEEYKFVEAQYRKEIDEYNERVIQSEVDKHVATAQRKAAEEQAKAAETHRGAIEAEVRAALGVK